MTNAAIDIETGRDLAGALQTRDPQDVQVETQEHLHRASAFLAGAKALIHVAHSGSLEDVEMKLSRIVYALGEIIDQADSKITDALTSIDCKFS